MKKTYTINISGIIFNIDEDAYENLNEYLKTIKSKFKNTVECEEIIKDIESRIAELFQEKLNDKNQVITIEHVKEIIDILGTPEEIDDDSSGNEEQKYENRSQRRLFRDPDNRIIGGVCAGLAAYFNIDRIIIRIIIIITFLFSGPLLYLILWIVIPEAKTTAQKLEMSGEKINIENIVKSIKNEFKKVKKSFNEYKDKGYRGSKSVADRFVFLLLTLTNFIIKVIIIVIGFSFILIGLAILIGLIGGVFVDSWGANSFNLQSLSNIFISHDNIVITLISLCLVIGIPVILIIMAGVKLIFRIKSKNKVVNWILFMFWFFGIIILALVTFQEVNKYSFSDSVIESKEIILPDSIKTVVLKFDTDKITDDESEHLDFEFISARKDYESIILFGFPKITVRRSQGDNINVSLIRKSNGEKKEIAKKNLEMIDYKYVQNDSIILFDPYFFVNGCHKWNIQKLEIEINIPEKYKIEGDRIFKDFN
ncbi:MAG: PspC domain-containing protein [Bacteroidota bacterium]